MAVAGRDGYSGVLFIASGSWASKPVNLSLKCPPMYDMIIMVCKVTHRPLFHGHNMSWFKLRCTIMSCTEAIVFFNRSVSVAFV